MTGSFRQPADGINQLFAFDISGLDKGFSLNQLSDCGTARHSGHAAFGAETNAGDAAGDDTHGELQHIAAGGILQLHGSVRSLDVPGIAWVLEMIEQLG